MPINPPARAREFQVLDPCLLGRPVHLLPAFANRLAETLGAAIAAPGGRRYWGAWRLAGLSFERAPDERQLRWLGVNGPYGMAAVAFERALLLGLLEGRYARNAPAAAQRDPQAERVTATEERLAATLAQQLAALLDTRVADGLAAAGAEPTPLTPNQASRAAVAPASAPGKTEWVLRIVLRAPYGAPAAAAVVEPASDGVAPADDAAAAPVAATAPASQDGQIWIALDHALMAHVLQGLMDKRTGSRGPRRPSEPLESSLNVKLDGRLVSKEVTLAALFALKVGDVIPVSVGRADVLLDDARLFTAAVAEHKGKLCLTSFEDAE
ncbi:FliM/FliN family flagellar motor C-terminal domain-containing protein [Massilia sp. YIM B02443]|uniref:FliM/FliN family flagellar motor C-terminal domain-containing protein n=1 Tax=Massilia sp. YIM B02443 TaxID=3050127 RepID=UPI0025B67BC4|nr:FliM/FliN family flagellar motor C-terminal domain-containing protein [Massilia sp. YIM B02443]MDN4035965.1 FliM/FliN family flagellar motor C-terminal domain-containing protein [Massilia sp. YIM B02443]